MYFTLKYLCPQEYLPAVAWLTGTLVHSFPLHMPCLTDM